MKISSVVALAALIGFAGAFSDQPTREYLYLWTASADSTQPDFLAVLDVTDSARLVTTLAVPGRGNRPHHTEYEMPRDRQLFANGFASGRTFIFDLKSPAAPRLVGDFGDLAGYHHPHSYLRLPNGNLLATFQMQHDSAGPVAGGLVELTPAGRVIRSSSANAPGLDRGLRVYSAAVVPALDRIVTTTTDMDPGRIPAREIQIWRLSDLKLLHTVTLPNGPAGTEAQYTAEPRVLADGRTVLVSTFSCGLFLLNEVSGDAPSGRLIASFPRKEGTFCAVPVVVGHYYLVTVPAWSAVVSLDVSDPAAPREVGRVALGANDVPHWIAVSPNQRRVVVTGYGSLQNRVVLLRFDPGTGALSLDGPGYRMDNGIPHGAVFGP